MLKGKPQTGEQANKIVQYKLPGLVPHKVGQGVQTNLEQREPPHGTAEIRDAIRGSRVVLETKMDLKTMDINHLRLDLRKVVERVTTTKEEVTTLLKTVHDLQATVAGLKCSATQMNKRLEDLKGE
ncbi:hypothetical protein NDU88_001131 [Pleurodeles waltl]|uniref:Uncharacterized protein n=1 Tax=Pleurodeles waltl TaxID=8319 RepID=A0AAV7VZB0_PLEWA|nr:hypothetical protein NDU88_001131 [Pleurodeles waltl]